MKKLPLIITIGLVFSASAALARDYIEIVGSSTVYPFSTVVAETFGNKTKFKTPKIESTGTGGGMKLFCAGTRDAFAGLALEGGCKTFKVINDLKKNDSKLYKQVCHEIREDGAYIEAGENDNLIVQKLG